MATDWIALGRILVSAAEPPDDASCPSRNLDTRSRVFPTLVDPSLILTESPPRRRPALHPRHDLGRPGPPRDHRRWAAASPRPRCLPAALARQEFPSWADHGARWAELKVKRPLRPTRQGRLRWPPQVPVSGPAEVMAWSQTATPTGRGNPSGPSLMAPTCLRYGFPSRGRHTCLAPALPGAALLAPAPPQPNQERTP